MKCPNDNQTLQMTAREGIEIDYCPDCRGVWLDRGELDKLIERGASEYRPARDHEQPGYDRRPEESTSYGDSYHDRRATYDQEDFGDRRYHKKRKKESFLGDIFDF